MSTTVNAILTSSVSALAPTPTSDDRPRDLVVKKFSYGTLIACLAGAGVAVSAIVLVIIYVSRRRADKKYLAQWSSSEKGKGKETSAMSLSVGSHTFSTDKSKNKDKDAPSTSTFPSTTDIV